MIAFDRSTSRSQEEVTGDLALIKTVVDGLTFGDRVAILDVCAAGRTEACRPWSRKMPALRLGLHASHEDSLLLADARDDVRREIVKLSRMPRIRGTDLFATLYDVSDLLQETNLPVTLVMFSDMLQDASGIWMSRGQVPEPSSIGTRLHPPALRNVCVSVVGADASTDVGRRVKTFWERYFGAAGSNFSGDRYRRRATAPEPLFCHSRSPT